MLTSCFGKVRTLPAHYVPVSISQGVPRGWSGLRYLALAPRWDMLKMSAEEYLVHYDRILDRLDPSAVIREIEKMVGNDLSAPQDLDALNDPDDPRPVPVLLCWEGPGQRCHRRYVAEWLQLHTGLIVAEYGFEQAAYPCYRDLPGADGRTLNGADLGRPEKTKAAAKPKGRTNPAAPPPPPVSLFAGIEEPPPSGPSLLDALGASVTAGADPVEF